MIQHNYPQAAADFAAPRKDPLKYPGVRPETSFVLAEGMVWPIMKQAATGIQSTLLNYVVSQSNGNSRQSINTFLESRGVAPLEARFPVIGYGSNPVPGQLISKFGEDAVVPVVLGSLSNADVAYNLISNNGYAFAEILFSSNYSHCEIGVTFLDEFQLKLMIETEQNYQLAYTPTPVTLESGDVLQGGTLGECYVFAGFRQVWVPRKYAAPMPIAELPSAGRAEKALTQEQCLNLVIQEFSLDARGIETPLQLAAKIISEAAIEEKPGKLKFDLQEMVKDDPRSLPPLADSLTLVRQDKLSTWASG